MAINLSSSFDMKNDIVIQRKMIHAIRIHRKAIELVYDTCILQIQDATEAL